MTNEGVQPATQPGPEQPRRKLSRGSKIGVLAILLVMVGVAVWGFWPKPKVHTEPTVPVSIADDGTYTVGTGAGQLTPGTYRTPTPAKAVDPLSCRWTLTSPSGAQTDQFTQDGGPMPDRVVTVAAGQTFQTQDCGLWVLAG